MTAQASNKSPSQFGADTFRMLFNEEHDTSNESVAGSMKSFAARLPYDDASVPKRKKKTYPSPQLVEYLENPSTAGPYTAFEDKKDHSYFVQRQKDMKRRLEVWQKDWDTMSSVNKESNVEKRDIRMQEGSH